MCLYVLCGHCEMGWIGAILFKQLANCLRMAAPGCTRVLLEVILDVVNYLIEETEMHIHIFAQECAILKLQSIQFAI